MTVQDWALKNGKWVVIMEAHGASDAYTEDPLHTSADSGEDEMAESPEKATGEKRKATTTMAEVRAHRMT